MSLQAELFARMCCCVPNDTGSRLTGCPNTSQTPEPQLRAALDNDSLNLIPSNFRWFVNNDVKSQKLDY